MVIYVHGRKKKNSEAAQENAEYEHRSKRRMANDKDIKLIFESGTKSTV